MHACYGEYTYTVCKGVYMYDMLPLSVGTAGPNSLTLFKVTPGYPDIKLLAGQKQTNFKQIKIKKMHEI